MDHRDRAGARDRRRRRDHRHDHDCGRRAQHPQPERRDDHHRQREEQQRIGRLSEDHRRSDRVRAEHEHDLAEAGRADRVARGPRMRSDQQDRPQNHRAQPIGHGPFEPHAEDRATRRHRDPQCSRQPAHDRRHDGAAPDEAQHVGQVRHVGHGLLPAQHQPRATRRFRAIDQRDHDRSDIWEMPDLIRRDVAKQRRADPARRGAPRAMQQHHREHAVRQPKRRDRGAVARQRQSADRQQEDQRRERRARHDPAHALRYGRAAGYGVDRLHALPGELRPLSNPNRPAPLVRRTDLRFVASISQTANL